MDIQTLSDRAEITDLLGLYCRGVDRVDEATLRSIYHEDAVEDRGEGLFIGNAQEWVTWTLELLPVFSLTQHNILNCLIDISRDTAHSETYFIAYHRFNNQFSADNEDPQNERTSKSEDVHWPEGEVELILAGRYLDRFERRNGKWKISYRKMVCDWCRTQKVADEWFRHNPTAYRGIRNINDSRLDD